MPLVKFTPWTQLKFLQALRLGCSRKEACGLAGIAEETLYAWFRLAEKATTEEDPYVIFCTKITQAEAERNGAVAKSWFKKATDGETWQASQKYLSIRDRANWGEGLTIANTVVVGLDPALSQLLKADGGALAPAPELCLPPALKDE